MRVYLPTLTAGRESAWLSLVCLLLWACTTSSQTSVETTAPDQTSAETSASDRATAETVLPDQTSLAGRAAGQPFYDNGVPTKETAETIGPDEVAPESRARTIQQHSAWMASCAFRGVEFLRSGYLDIYAVDVSHIRVGRVVSCLLSIEPDAALPETIVGTSELMGIGLRTAFYTTVGSGNVKRRATAALIKTPRVVYIVQSNINQDIVGLQHVRDDVFLVSTRRFVWDHNYLFRATTGDTTYLSSGEMTFETKADLRFRFTNAHSRWKYPSSTLAPNFSYDAIVDQHGNILDLVTPRTGKYIRCMRREAFIGRSTVDISRVDASEVCVRN